MASSYYRLRIRAGKKKVIKLYFAITLLCLGVAGLLTLAVEKGTALMDKFDPIPWEALDTSTVEELKKTYRGKIDNDDLQRLKKVYDGKLNVEALEKLKKEYQGKIDSTELMELKKAYHARIRSGQLKELQEVHENITVSK